MAKRISKKYFYYQVLGWGLLLFLGWALLGFQGRMASSSVVERMIMEAVAGILVSHLLRIVIIRCGWLQLSIKAAVPRLLPLVILACIAAGLVKRMGLYLLDERTMGVGVSEMLIADVIEYSLLLGPWTMLYYLYHYVGKVYREGAKNRRLEVRVNEMKKQAEASGTNMEAMIEMLKRIQLLIEEDPGRSREEITEFSRVLRKGYLS